MSRLSRIDDANHVADLLTNIQTLFAQASPNFVLDVFLDFDDTISNQKATETSKRPVINMHVVSLVAKMMYRFGSDRLRFSIITTRFPDSVIHASIAYMRMQSALPVFHDALNQALQSLMSKVAQKHSDIFKNRFHHCDREIKYCKLDYFVYNLNLHQQSEFVFIDDQREENCFPVMGYFSKAHVLQSVVSHQLISDSPVAPSRKSPIPRKIWRGLNPKIKLIDESSTGTTGAAASSNNQSADDNQSQRPIM